MTHLGHCVGDFLARRLPSGQQERAEQHLLDCAHCRLLVARERHRLHLMQAAAGPEPAADLAQRILSRTQSLNTGGNERLCLPYRRHRRARNALIASAMAAVFGVLSCGAAYVVGGNDAAARPGVSAGAMTGRWPVAISAAKTVRASSVQRAAPVNAAAIQQLKAAGWACPELESLGFSLRSADGFVRAGVPTLELVLSNGANTVALYEQRPQREAAAGGSGIPVNALTGHDAQTDGFEPTSTGGVQLWLHPGRPWQLIFREDDATYTVSTDLPASAVAAVTAAIAGQEHRRATDATSGAPATSGPTAATGTAQAAPSSDQLSGNDWMTRIERGFSRLVPFK
ncbi:hypothetical protein IV498_12665 [Paenarthrobacter sp. Z7-10]|uniref:hypothetical protein n=1 Tax=Paenarthrobacter sp. Z7-10 TaxID=2787635 RepID=UPI0022A93626|nr:hypothetical protein [Paenarthrobacter sp. Z7-10]MCZ2404010.1 hypothetical protein [Paenarthrobacter sp. Z7-10]